MNHIYTRNFLTRNILAFFIREDGDRFFKLLKWKIIILKNIDS